MPNEFCQRLRLKKFTLGPFKEYGCFIARGQHLIRTIFTLVSVRGAAVQHAASSTYNHG
jgi:hypothetical protein